MCNTTAFELLAYYRTSKKGQCGRLQRDRLATGVLDLVVLVSV